MALKILTFDDFITRAYAADPPPPKRGRGRPKTVVDQTDTSYKALDNHTAKDRQNRPRYAPGKLDEFFEAIVAWRRRHRMRLSLEDCRATVTVASSLLPVAVTVDQDRHYEDETYLNRVWAASIAPLSLRHAKYRGANSSELQRRWQRTRHARRLIPEGL